MEKKVLTPEGLRKLQEELNHLKTIKRHEVADRIKQAKEYGDLSENAEYQEAKDEQSFVEGRVLELENLIKIAEVAKDIKNPTNVIVGSKVLIERDGRKMNFSIVGSTEAEPASGKISLESPLGGALLGKEVGDEVNVELPSGISKCKILEIK